MFTFRAAAMLAVFLPIATANAAQAQTNMPLTQPPGWVLDWHDEFDGKTLDRTKWVPETGGNGWGNQELEFYTDRPDNVRVDGGNLVIEARKEDYGGRHYTSARIKTAG